MMSFELPSMLGPSVQGQPEGHAPVNVVLEDGDLWGRFNKLINEMIVTKSGRRMFPLVKVNISGLEPKTFYTILLEFKQVGNNRWKYINGEWLPGNGNYR